MSKIKFLIFLCLIISSFQAAAQTYRTTGNSTNWNDASAWVGGNIPSPWSSGTVIIDHPITHNNASRWSLTGYLDFEINSSLTFTGDFLIGSWGDPQIIVNPGASFNVNGHFTHQGPGYVNNLGTVSAGSYVTDGTGPVYDNYGTTNVTNRLQIKVGIFNSYPGSIINAGEIYANGGQTALNETDINIDRDFTITSSGKVDINQGTLDVGNDFLYTGSSNTNISALTTIEGDLTCSSGGATLTLNNDVAVKGNFSNSNGTNVVVNETLDITGNLSQVGFATLTGKGVVGWGSYTLSEGSAYIGCQDGTKYGAQESYDGDPPPENPLDLNICGPVLPVELISIDVEPYPEGQYALVWSTASEKNNDYFIVEYSPYGNHFSEIGRVDGKGTVSSISNYSFILKNGLSGYFRLTQVDFDGASEISPVVYHNVESEFKPAIAPNPSNGNFKIKGYLQEGGIVGISISDATGRKILEEENYFYSGAFSKDFDLNLPSGLYLVNLKTVQGNEIFKLVIKN